MRSIALLCLATLLSFIAYGQKDDSLAKAVNDLHQKLIQADNSDTAVASQYLVALEQLYAASIEQNYQLGIELCGTDLVRRYLRSGQYQKVIEIGHSLIGASRSFVNSTTATETHRMLGLAYSNLGLYEKSMEEYRLSLAAIEQVKTIDFQHYLRAITYENLTSYFEFTGKHLDSCEYYYKKSLEEALLISDTSSRLPSNYKFNAILYCHKDLADYYLNVAQPAQPEKAEAEIKIALRMNEEVEGQMMISNKIAFLATLCRSYYYQQDYKKTVQYGLEGLKLEASSPSPYNRVEIYKALAHSYLAENNIVLSGKYLSDYTALKDSLQISEKRQTSAAVQQMLARQSAAHQSSAQKIMLWACIAVLAIGIAVLLIWKRKSRKLRRQYETIIGQLKEQGRQKGQGAQPYASAATPAPVATDDARASARPDTGDSELLIEQPALLEAEQTNGENEVGKGGPEDDCHSWHTVASDKTLAKLLEKLEQFEQEMGYLSPEISLTALSNYVGTNQTYLSELLKVHRGNTYRNYINGLKIEYIKNKLYEEPIYREYKINHLASECGFASRQVFISAFKKQTGMPPSYFINRLKTESED